MAINVSREISVLAPTAIKSMSTTNTVMNLVKYGELSIISPLNVLLACSDEFAPDFPQVCQ